MHSESGRDSFSSKIGFVLAAAGSAVGLGNLWRFPYLAEQYGGGIFLLVYILLAVVFGFTLLMTELALGRRTRKSCVSAFEDLSRKHRAIGWFAALIPIIIVPYYCVIGGWVAKYLFESAGGGLDAISETGFFPQFVGCELGGVLGDPLTWFLLFALATVVLVYVGVDKGIEKMSKVLMPVLLGLILLITVYVLTLPGSMDGAARYLVPDFSKLSASTFLGAMGQLFYSMSLAMGIMITYGSYMKKDVDIPKSARRISLIDTSVAMLAGLMIVPAVYAFSEAGISSGPSLMFVTLPKVFDVMPGGYFVAILFFLLVLFAALTSAVSLAETVASVFMDRFKASRRRATLITAAVILGLGILSCYGYGPLSGFELAGMAFLDLFDFLSNSIMMPVAAIMTCLFVGYVVKPSFILEEVEATGEFRLKPYYGILVKWVCPVFLAMILAVGLLSFLGVYSIRGRAVRDAPHERQQDAAGVRLREGGMGRGVPHGRVQAGSCSLHVDPFRPVRPEPLWRVRARVRLLLRPEGHPRRSSFMEGGPRPQRDSPEALQGASRRGRIRHRCRDRHRPVPVRGAPVPAHALVPGGHHAGQEQGGRPDQVGPGGPRHRPAPGPGGKGGDEGAGRGREDV